MLPPVAARNGSTANKQRTIATRARIFPMRPVEGGGEVAIGYTYLTMSVVMISKSVLPAVRTAFTFGLVGRNFPGLISVRDANRSSIWQVKSTRRDQLQESPTFDCAWEGSCTGETYGASSATGIPKLEPALSDCGG